MTAPIQFSGVSSGLNTKAIIDAIIASDQRPLKLLQSKLAQVQQRQTALDAIKVKVVSVQTNISNLTLNGTVNGKAATSTDSNILTATANGDAATGALSVRVKQLATATVATSTSAIGQDIDPTAFLADVAGSSPAGLATTPTSGFFTVNGKTVTITDATAATLNDVRDAINDPGVAHGGVTAQAGIGVTASVVTVNGRKRLELTADAGQSIQLGAAADSSNFLTATKLLAAETTTTQTGAGAGEIQVGDMTAGNDATISSVDVSAAKRGDTYTFSFDGTNQLTLTSNTDASKTQTITISASGAGQSRTLSFDQLGIKVTISGVSSAGETTTDIGNRFDLKTITTTETVQSQSNLGTASPSAALSSARLAIDSPVPTLAASGSFTINATGTAVTINWTNSDSLNDVISRINASTGGVVAAYDLTQDKLTITSKTTGSSLISLADTAGNFLTAMNVVAGGVTDPAAQVTGQNAVIAVNGSADFSSASNRVTGAVAGVTLNLKSPGTTEVAVSQDVDTTVSAVKALISSFNSAFDLIREDTKFDSATKTSGVLFGDFTAQSLARTLRSLVTSRFTGATSSDRFQSLVHIGISFGAVGSALGTTNDLVLDETALRNAIATDPVGVAKVFNAFTNAVDPPLVPDQVLNSTGGTPIGVHQSGSYAINWSTDAAGTSATLNAAFTPTGGTAQPSTTGTIAPGSTNTGLIPGVTIAATGAFPPSTAGSNTLSVVLNDDPLRGPVGGTLGVAYKLNDYLRSALGISGLFRSGDDAADRDVRDLNSQIDLFQLRLIDERAALERKFANLESALSSLQQQGNALTAQLGVLNQQRSSR